MSRIQQAIEKAARLRAEAAPPPGQWQQQVQPHLPEKTESAELPARGPIPEAPVELKVEHPMLRDILAGHGVVSEQFRKLRTEVSRRTQGDAFRNTLLITSSISGEGKTLTSLNLAIALAQDLDHTVLLVDADLRRPMIHKYLGLDPAVGLIQVLSGEVHLEDALIRTGIGKLVVLPAGGQLENPAEMLTSSRMKALVAELKQRYADRYVIFDGTPSLLFAEPRALAMMMDGVLYVVREGISKPGLVKQGLALMQDSTIFGLVYNDTALDLTGKGYYGYGYY